VKSGPVTHPVPVPASRIVSVRREAGAWRNETPTLRSPFMVTVQVAVVNAAQSPLQVSKTRPVSATAVSVTVVPCV
jgi:hypothetical protein